MDCVLEIGGPIATAPSPDSTRSTEDQTVVSVGPYMFQSSPPHFSKLSASFRGIASPPHNILSDGYPSQPASSNSRHVTGVAA
jgi:hypothetical protein